MDQSIFTILPLWIRTAAERAETDGMEELRLRMGQPPTVVLHSREVVLCGTGQTVQVRDLEFVLSAATSASLYSANETLRQGYLTLQGGHRLGLCGKAVVRDGEIATLQNISSVSLRIASDRRKIGIAPATSTLIIGLPGSGKTTLLRDCIRILSDELSQRVSLVDERGEIAATVDGVPQFSVGKRTDVLTGAPKAEGMNMLLRTMNPQWIAVDEITKEADADALIGAAYCGVKLLATAHAGDVEDLYRRPVYRKMMEACVFSQILVLHPDHSYTVQEVECI